MIKILVITGTRADYGIYYPILKAMQSDSYFDLHLLVTGMHLSPQHGYSIQHIKNDGFQISAKVDTLLLGSSHGNMARSIGLAVLGMTQSMEQIMPDIVMVLGDRGEMLAGAIVASHMNIPVVHLHGGEVSGTIDESVRHAISKLSHIHFAATDESSKRLIRLGEDSWRVHTVGAPRIETIQSALLPGIQDIKGKYGLKFSGSYILFIYHPVTTSATEGNKLKDILNVVLGQGDDVICVLPNADACSDDILSVYREFAEVSKIHLVSNFEQMDYLSVLKHANILVGNSSSGIIEAASFHIPVINIGTRQQGRERSVNVIDISEDPVELENAFKLAFSNSFKNKVDSCQNVYGRGNTSAQIMDILKQQQLDQNLIQKTIAY
ncbi:UDP-N-acetylglucosamine 2-epimerase [Paenibacillus chibensis]|uniref:UDP-N-acetylglucosamine 2-epimerase n=1 Tax=Paenibacillus chibensis TaxID=59846 RepID=UPI000FD6DDF9|nr:UDP-N-acetylglucosamine 2-epimerase [Paenibacillus chibensis]MEC0370794.1 UDP-N-acetylglucosamine 2-epimerase [Paenibacillus chibensis]